MMGTQKWYDLATLALVGTWVLIAAIGSLIGYILWLDYLARA